MDVEWTLTLSEIADGEAAQALAQGLRTPQEVPAIAAPFQAEGGKGTIGTKTGILILPASHAAQGAKGPAVTRTLPSSAAAQGGKPLATYLPAATLAQGGKPLPE